MRSIIISYEITLGYDHKMELTDEQYAALESGKLDIDDIDPDVLESINVKTWDKGSMDTAYRIYSENYDKQIR